MSEEADWLREQADKPTQAVYANQLRRIALLLENIQQKNAEMRRTIEYARDQAQTISERLGSYL